MSRFSELKKSAQELRTVLSPYLGSRKQRERHALAIACVVAHLVEIAVNTYFIEEAEAAAENETTWNTIVPTFGAIIFNAFMYAFTVSMSNYMNHSMTESLVKANGLDGWLHDNASLGIDFLQSMPEGRPLALSADTPVERVLTEHIKGVSKGTVKLFVENSNRLFSSIVGLYVIAELANLNTTLFYLLIGGGLVGVCTQIDKKRIALGIKISDQDDTINARFTHVRERASQILALDGERYEVSRIEALLAKRQQLAKKSFRLEARNNTVMYATFFGMGPLSLLLAVYLPSVLQAPVAGSVAASLFQQNVFQLMINFFIVMENYTQEYPKFGSSLGKVRSLQSLLGLWREFQAKKSLDLVYSEEKQTTDGLQLQHFNLSMPTRQTDQPMRELLTDVNLNLPQGVYHLTGASNAGKSTTFKAIMGLWPYASGMIHYPCLKNQIRFIPQETFIPYDATLMDMLIYPATSAESVDREDILNLMKLLNLAHLIPTLDEKRDLKALSRGEQQRLAIISAVLARPALLLMDEATASIDATNKKKAEVLIQERLPNSSIIMIDHSPSTSETTVAIENENKESAESDHWVITIDSDDDSPGPSEKNPTTLALTHSVMFQQRRAITIDATNKKLQLQP